MRKSASAKKSATTPERARSSLSAGPAKRRFGHATRQSAWHSAKNFPFRRVLPEGAARDAPSVDGRAPDIPDLSRRLMPRTAHLLVAAALLATIGCGAPQRLPSHRSALLYPDLTPLVPEGRIAHLPSESADTAEARALAQSDLNGERIARAAESKVGARSVNDPGQRFNEDCSGLTRAVFSAQGVDLFADGVNPGENGVSAIYRFVARRGGLHEGNPRPGELVFFRDTADSNRDGRENDGLTHIGIVTGVDPGGTVHLVHRNSQGIVRERMNLSLPERHKAESGDVLNDWLRGGARPRLMGELFVSYGRLASP